ncbi:CBO0543 family protein [Neobacillus drentensis]|uniref:CBO0543 family protein n=1 Tax=Neobacillus drentensis TaxID=220684 RepID=UPI002FFF0B99
MENNDKVIKIIDKNVDKIENLIDLKIKLWREHVLFSGLWWMGIFLSILPWVIWFVIRKKQSTDLLLYVGFYVMSISVMLDIIGDQIGLWHYRYHVIPVLPTYFPWDMTLMPLTIMVLLQFRPNSNPWLKAIFFALMSSYLAEPFFTWLTVYNPIHWRFTYSVPIQIAIYMSAYWLSLRTKFSPLNKEH